MFAVACLNSIILVHWLTDVISNYSAEMWEHCSLPLFLQPHQHCHLSLGHSVLEQQNEQTHLAYEQFWIQMPGTHTEQGLLLSISEV